MADRSFIPYDIYQESVVTDEAGQTAPRGLSPQMPIIKQAEGAGIDFSTRAMLSASTSDYHRAAVLMDAFGPGKVNQNPSDPDQWVVMKDDGKWYSVDEVEGWTAGDIADWALPATEMVAEGAGAITGGTLGGIGGGTVTAPAGGVGLAPGVVAGAGVGAGVAAGATEYGRQKIMGATGVDDLVRKYVDEGVFPEDALQTMGAQAGMEAIGQKALFAGGADIATGGALNILGKTLAPFRSALSRGSRAALARARNYGMDLALGDLNSGGMSSLLEGALTNMFGSRNIMRDFRMEQLGRITEMFDGWAQAVGKTTKISPRLGVQGIPEAAEVATGSLKAAKTMRRVHKMFSDHKYAEVALLAGDTPLRFPALRTAVNELLSASKMAGTVTEKDVLSVMGDKAAAFVGMMGKVADGEAPFLFAQQMRSKLGGAIDDKLLVSNADTGAMKKLFGAISKDMDSFAKSQGGDLQRVYNDARRFYKEGDRIPGVALMNSKAGKKLLRMAEDDPDKLVGAFFKPKNSTELKTLKAIVGEKRFDVMKEEWVGSELLSTIGILDLPAGSAKDLAFSVDGLKLRNFLNKYGEETLNTIFSKTELRHLRRLQKLARSAEVAKRTAANPSGTAQIVLLGSAIGSAGSGLTAGFSGDEGFSPQRAAAGAAGFAVGSYMLPKLLAKAILSRPVRRYGSTGWSLPLKASAAAMGAAPAGARTMLDIAGAEQEDIMPFYVPPSVREQR